MLLKLKQLPEYSIVELEGHTVDRMYLRQRCFDGRVNKTILKPRAAAVAGRVNTHRPTWDFPDVKFGVPALIRYRRKQSGSGIRTIIRIGLNQFVNVPTSVDTQTQQYALIKSCNIAIEINDSTIGLYQKIYAASR